MIIVTDRGADIAPEQLKDLDIHFASLRIELDGKTYESGIDLDGDAFYKLLSATDSFPTTSQPSAGEFAALYRQLAEKGEEILSIHISSGLSGTFNAASAGAQMVPEAKITLWDSKTLSCPLGWQVETAARMAQGGASVADILQKLSGFRDIAEGIFTLDTLKYLIHGGRISHITGLLASVLNIKPVIGVDKITGKYVQMARHVSIKRSIQGVADVVAQKFGAGTRLRVQLLHGNNPEGIALLREKMNELFECVWLPSMPIAPVLGAHTGPGLVGLAVGPESLFAD
ncbi:MAG TPA: DegV family protein [Bellilinea sp.]|nr:DegV family protein [Bellilinea sp.]